MVAEVADVAVVAVDALPVRLVTVSVLVDGLYDSEFTSVYTGLLPLVLSVNAT